jgi:hypothetical protein
MARWNRRQMSSGLIAGIVIPPSYFTSLLICSDCFLTVLIGLFFNFSSFNYSEKSGAQLLPANAVKKQISTNGATLRVVRPIVIANQLEQDRVTICHGPYFCESRTAALIYPRHRRISPGLVNISLVSL